METLDQEVAAVKSSTQVDAYTVQTEPRWEPVVLSEWARERFREWPDEIRVPWTTVGGTITGTFCGFVDRQSRHDSEVSEVRLKRRKGGPGSEDHEYQFLRVTAPPVLAWLLDGERVEYGDLVRITYLGRPDGPYAHEQFSVEVRRRA